MAKIRVLVVEDSLTVRKRMVEVFAADPDIEIVGEADDGKRGIELCQQLRPDVITLDMMLPVMSGLAATEFIMAYCPTPILIVSASTNRGELFKTYEALAAGALDVLDKPLGKELDDAWERKLVTTVKLLSRIKVITHLRARLGPMGQPPVGPASIEAGSRARTPAAPVVERQALQGRGSSARRRDWGLHGRASGAHRDSARIAARLPASHSPRHSYREALRPRLRRMARWAEPRPRCLRGRW
jgi:two-component system chemotaxis response regulator CheB